MIMNSLALDDMNNPTKKYSIWFHLELYTNERI
jgi:hypothetical protein